MLPLLGRSRTAEALAERRQNARQQVQRRARHRADAQRAHASLRGVARRLQRGLGAVEQAPGFIQEGDARDRQPHALAVALEQLGADFGLQPLDGDAERRLGHVQPLGGLR